MINVMDLMKKTTAMVKGSIQSPITYNHLKNNVLQEAVSTTATEVSLQNYRFAGENIKNAKRFILSPRLINGQVEDPLPLKVRQNDTIESNGETWYVLEASPRDVELDILCSQDFFSISTQKARF